MLDALGRPGPDEPSLQGVGWLPAPVAAVVERRTTEVVPAAVAAAPWRPGRRTFITGIGAGVQTVAAAASVPLTGGTADGGETEAAADPPEPPPRGVPKWKWRFPGESVGLRPAGGVVLASTGEDDARAVHALDPRTGEVLWERANAYATVAGDDVYLAEDDRVRAVRASSGDTRWTYDFAFGEGGVQAASGSVVCFGISGEQSRIGALSSKDGRRRWTSEPFDRLAEAFAGDDLVVAAAPTGLTALDAETGRPRWTYRIDNGAHLVIDRGLVLAWDRLGTLHALRAADGRPAWKHRNTSALTILLDENHVYLEEADGVVVALDTATGRPAWSRRIAHFDDDPRAQATMLCLDGGTLYAACRDATLYALGAADGRVRWTYQAEAIRLTPPVGAAGLVCVATKDGHVRALAPPDTPGGSRAGP
ncbi:hypothetical protein BJF79_11460 [Actinomadura sp. CNU-125]|uniref:outer membrane protein assembly factor BamB family protein n=1 Tax=Actinomadura sp. CNU-125 TaxID=1904961 RepID=UPI00095BF39C|nr:PQQ-binding-like beta-propeller repeat protein [Actinomadura sp. CNU-125]OLT27493.1 hypothetical protein BJF79_11460 [Actinomadura sp. CNU-125]